ncbi:group-specific protein [Litchfieldia salsa]|uniref:Group-specific protein n=1 Tax=Litchfieldia salsa TaxID=930152 RepID=A0A1H0Q9Y9_9BACI|nr:group-specific protein [Litchfieldia salsa]SDP14134.1 hypothetical protein SAMN05216565_101669 [Litchfieldia salsa]
MSTCKLDHSLEDVLKKLNSQKAYLPSHSYTKCKEILDGDPSQTVLNELFHLLKKYDLAAENEKTIREKKIEIL